MCSRIYLIIKVTHAMLILMRSCARSDIPHLLHILVKQRFSDLLGEGAKMRYNGYV